MARSRLGSSPAFNFVLTMGVVNLFGDMTYEGGGARVGKRGGLQKGGRSMKSVGHVFEPARTPHGRQTVLPVVANLEIAPCSSCSGERGRDLSNLVTRRVNGNGLPVAPRI
jgi:hypothetical protein